MIGRQGGPQRISLGHGCLRGGIGVTVHEMMHALGFYHEQSRRDRNRYIRINFQNISPSEYKCESIKTANLILPIYLSWKAFKLKVSKPREGTLDNFLQECPFEDRLQI